MRPVSTLQVWTKDMQQFLEQNIDLPVSQICTILGVKQNIVYYYRKQILLKKRKVETDETKPPIVRVKESYSNQRSLYGIDYDQLLSES